MTCSSNMLNQLKIMNSVFFCRIWSVMRGLSTTASCKQHGLPTRPKPSPWLNFESTKVGPQGENQREREDLAAAYRGMAYYGLSEGVCNHLSARAPARNGDGEVMLIIKYGIHWTEVTSSSLLGINLTTGRVVEGSGEPETSAAAIHSAVHTYALNSKLPTKAVFHSHPPNATTLACLEDPTLLMIHQNSARFFKDIVYDNGYDGLATVDTESCRIAKQLGDKSVMLMGQHGVLVTGKSTVEAFDKTYYLERAAQIQVLGLSTGKKMVEMSDDLASTAKKQIEDDANFAPAHFGAIKRIMAYTYPGDFTS